jgi:hypothetical protein
MHDSNIFNTYIGIPYRDKGRDRDGLDCWGLVRLVHMECYSNYLPSFIDNYESSKDSNAHMREVISRSLENWARVDTMQPGDIAVFRVMGFENHVGIITRPGYFLHIREGKLSTIERLNSVEWKRRLEGIYRYSPGSGITVAATLHPLKTERIHTALPYGMTVKEMVDVLRVEAKVPLVESFKAVVWLDGKRVDIDHWDLVPVLGSRVEIRVVAGSGAIRQIAMLALVILASIFVPMLLAGLPAIAISVAQVAVVAAGALLINYLFPIREPKPDREPKNQRLLTGGSNQANLYGAIPIVLGKHRFTPPLAASQYVESDSHTSYLRMALCWGYGELQISDLRIGETRIDTLEELEYETLNGIAGEDQRRFIQIYGKDTTQLQIGLALEVPDALVVSAIRTAGVITIITEEEHEFTSGDICRLTGFDELILLAPEGPITDLVDDFTFKFTSAGADGEIKDLIHDAPRVTASPWIEKVLDSEVDKIGVNLHFPEGLRYIKLKGEEINKSFTQAFQAHIEVRQLDSVSLVPITPWGNINKKIKQTKTVLNRAWFNVDNDDALEAIFQWHRFSVDAYGKVIIRHGAFTEAEDNGPSARLLERMQEDNFGLDVEFARLPEYGPGEEGLWDVQVFGNSFYRMTDRRTSDITGCNIIVSNRTITIESGTIDRAQVETVRLGADGQLFNKRKDAFSYNVMFDVPLGRHEIRVRRLTPSNTEYKTPDGNSNRRRYSASYLQTITGYSNNKAITPPAPLAMTSFRIKATNQLNSNIEGITGTVISVCLDWENVILEWVDRPTRNPASLFRYVLQHPANSQRVTDSKINLDDVIAFHNYCRWNNFKFDMVIVEQRSIYDVLLDICAAGRASPTMRDGQWTVIIDQQKTEIAQLFSPHNSWGFEGTRTLPKIPHGFRVQFFNEKRGFQDDEMIVYNDGYGPSNAKLFETIQLPGVTNSDTVFKHGRFHLAQLKLRPEIYTINVDIEHLACTRGDLVRVTHDVPMWGLGTGRIRERISGTQLLLDEEMTMAANTPYTIRIRLEDGTNITRTVLAKPDDGYYSTIDLANSVDAIQGKADNLFLFGELSSESVELLVLSIEPAENMTARIQMIDYAPDIYLSDIETIPDFDSQITLPPFKMQRRIKTKPIVTEIRSDESVITINPSGGYNYGLRVAWTELLSTSVPTSSAGVASAGLFVQAQIEYANPGISYPTGDTSLPAPIEIVSLGWFKDISVPAQDQSVTFTDLNEGEFYIVRLRYVDDVGNSGPWKYTSSHRIVGKLTRPSPPTDFISILDNGRILFSWDVSPEIDVIGYEIRTTDSGFGTKGYVWKGSATNAIVTPPLSNPPSFYYLRSYDAAKLYSETSAIVSFAVGLPKPVTNLRPVIVDNNVLLYWTLPEPTSYPISHVLVKKGSTWAGAVTIGSKKGSFTSILESVGGLYRYWIATVDTGGNVSSPVYVDANVSEPPDFVLNAVYEADFVAGTKSNSFIDTDNSLVLPVNTTETWTQHFTNNSADTIQDLIDAGLTVFIQPSVASGYFEETYNFGTILGLSKINVNYVGEVIVGNPVISITISVSDDNSNWTDFANSISVFAQNFQYVKIRFTVTSDDNLDVYKLFSIETRLDAKLINDAGNISAVSTDASGTIVNFTREFIDITSITVSPLSTSALIASYDFQDSVLSGTYAVAANVLTVSINSHGLIAGQKVRLAFTSGTAPNGVYTVATKVNDNQFTVSLTTGNTSGNLVMYPEGFRVYLFNNSGTRVSGTVSWSAKGY